ncbi:hypothetical protein R69927_03898 [Paraburkholderia domus]|jgi:hypothetical protein|uniref:Lipoprotein n=1 Tax=Paraburkholderia domus TaxID=2793075 RepID=A0A9N8N179_9BURK|nr:hypothetical protein [Paraburkholderia domus]MBK5050931.1 hypothetical protein [Burkholderia sp. R-70006]MBK5061070.1 hypothetical protein [Burkholderia sp. R-70199]MBK5088200.1 hypothetical protein [Burkholderia sp. R-69927]MBK5121202.1 hypothetical protein [Burkholderia sp. R-69980]MBK5166265.1 hypothetical protein [Burkholderia sp. R-70211]
MKSVYYLLRGCGLAGVLLAGAATAGTTCNKQPIQPQSVQAIGRDMIVNGVPTSVVGMQYAGTPNDVSKAFREFWTSEDVPAKGQSSPSGMLLSALDDHCLYVLSIPPQPEGASTRGLMSVIKLGNDEVRHRIPDSAVPLPEGGKVVSDIESRDPGQTGRTWLLDMPGDARWNAQKYRSILATQGWTRIGRQPDYQSGVAQSTQGTAFVMQHGGDSVDASFSDRNGRTFAVINATRSR